MSPSSPTAALLLEHRSFLRRLARSLVFDDHRAEDIVQDAYLVALKRPLPAPGRVRGWLAGITRNVARNTQRSERRLRERHVRGARSEAVVSTSDMASRLEAQRVIAEAIEALDEPGRTVLVRRYFDDCKTGRIAKELGLPVRTVESRLRRAKAALRTSLDQHFGNRGQWCAALLPITGVGTLTSGATTTGSVATTGATTHAVLLGGLAMTSKALVGSCVAAALVGSAVGWALKPAPEVVVDSEHTVPVVGDSDAGDAPTLGTSEMAAQAERRQLETQLATAQDTIKRLQGEMEALANSSAVPITEEKRLELAQALKLHRFRFKKLDKGLGDVDWKEVAASVNGISEVVGQIATEASAGRPVGPELQQKAMQLNAPLVKMAFGLTASDVPGTGVNGSFTHPAVTVNLVYAALEEAGQPLDEGQLEKLKALGSRYVAEAAALPNFDPKQDLAFEGLWREFVLKDQLYRDIDALLNPEQLAVLHKEEMRDRMMADLFSAGLLWQPYVQARFGATRDEVAASTAKLLSTQLKVDPADQPIVERLVQDWVGKMSNEAIGPLDTLEKSNFVRMDRIRAAGPPMLALYQELYRELANNEAARTQLRASNYLLLPVLPE